MARSQDLDVEAVIVGGGAAGLSAGLVLVRARRAVLLVDTGRQRNRAAGHLHGFLSRDGSSVREFLAAAREEFGGYGGTILSDEALHVEQDGAGFSVTLRRRAEPVSARRVIAATGLTDVLPELQGVTQRWGRDVLHCPYCHGWEVRDRRLGVLATGPSSFHQALLVRQWSGDVTLLLDSQTPPEPQQEAQLTARGIEVVPGTVTDLVVDPADRLAGVRLADGRVVPVDALFTRPYFAANDRLWTALGVTTCHDEGASWVEADAVGRTSVPGLFAAGNLTDPTAQLIEAAAAGARAAIEINAELVARDVASNARTG